jgi:hypothetical protein
MAGTCLILQSSFGIFRKEIVLWVFFNKKAEELGVWMEGILKI